MTIDTRPTRCYWILETQFHPEHGYIPSVVTQDEPGHAPCIGNGEFSQPLYFGKTLDAARSLCDAINEETFGLLPDQTQAIFESSIVASMQRDAERSQHDDEYDRALGRA